MEGCSNLEGTCNSFLERSSLLLKAINESDKEEIIRTAKIWIKEYQYFFEKPMVILPANYFSVLSYLHNNNHGISKDKVLEAAHLFLNGLGAYNNYYLINT